MTKSNMQDKLLMPEFAIDDTVNGDNVVPGIKRMYDIAHALKDSLMQWGAPGVGKSQAVIQWNAQKVIDTEARIAAGEKVKPWNPKVIDVRLSMKEPVDMVGVPIPVTADNGKVSTVWATPSMWPEDNGEFSGGVIHLDEMNQGQPAILNAAFQLIQDRALGDYKVPEGYMIIGSSNTNAYNATVSEFSIPLSNRFSHFNVKPDFDSWLDYKLNNGGNLDVMTFLKTQGMNMLFDKQGMEKQIGNMADALFTDIVVTPRSWEVIEKLLALPEGEKSNGGFSTAEKMRYATGRLGLMGATQLFQWLENKHKYQDWKEILVDGKDFKSEESDQYWAVQLACVATITNTADDKLCRKYVVNFMKAVNNLSKVPYKIMNLTQMARLPRLAGNLDLFNPAIDAKDIVREASKTIAR